MGYFDIQVNGYAGVDFNADDLCAEAMHRACERLLRDGVTGALATIITEQPERMLARIGRIAQLRAADPLVTSVIAGIHVEGPFISPLDGFRGAHPLDAVCQASVDLAGQLVDAGEGLVKLFTLAPEQDAGGWVSKYLGERGVLVSAGHTDASLDQLKACIDNGLALFTHLGNGCPALLPRHDNIIQRALSLREHLWLCFIADNVHVPFMTLRNLFDLIGIETGKLLVTTDAMSAAGLGAGLHRLGRWEVLVGEDLAARSADGSHLVGSAISMPESCARLRGAMGLSEAQIRRLTCENPRRALGFEGI